jgi:hypothetical protein
MSVFSLLLPRAPSVKCQSVAEGLCCEHGDEDRGRIGSRIADWWPVLLGSKAAPVARKVRAAGLDGRGTIGSPAAPPTPTAAGTISASAAPPVPTAAAPSASSSTADLDGCGTFSPGSAASLDGRGTIGSSSTADLDGCGTFSASAAPPASFDGRTIAHQQLHRPDSRHTAAPPASTAATPTAPPASTAATPAAPPASTAATPAAPPASLPAEAEMSEANRRQIQETLRRLDYYRGPVDGIFGPLTRTAIRRFQREIGADTTGYLTAEEANRLVSR